MNKQKFLKELGKKLEILSETEKEDILNEYRDIIEEKVKHGKTEEEAVKEFGSIDELSKEILSTYKINPEYNQKKSEAGDKAKEFVENTEGLIKKGAKKLSEVTEGVVEGFKKSDIEFTTEKIFEIILKVIFVLMGLALLKLPFYLIGELGASIFNIGFAPFNWLSEVVWKILVEVIYLAACVLIIFSVIVKYAQPSSKKIETTHKKKEQEAVVESESTKKKVKSSQSSNIIIIILKIWVCVVILFPIWCANFGLMVAVAFVIYLLWQGVHMVGILVLLLGLTFIGFELGYMIYNLLFVKKKVHLSSFVIGFVMIIMGSFMTLDYISEFTFYNTLPEEFIQGTNIYEQTITVPTHIRADHVEIIVDPTLEDYKSKLEVTYYKEYVTVEKDEITNSINSYNTIYFLTHNVHNSFHWTRDIKEKLIKQLNRKEVYNYGLLDDVAVKIYVNETTKGLIQ